MGQLNNRIFSGKVLRCLWAWMRRLSRCELSRRECGLRPSVNTASSNGSKIWLRTYCVL
jgi:hypothetical protein